MAEINYEISIDDTNEFVIELNEQGPQGLTGEKGADGFSPIATVVKTQDGAIVTITDKNGTTTAHLYNGYIGVSDVNVNGSSVVTDNIANITVPTNNNQLINGEGYITGIDSSDVISALGYTPYNSNNPNGYTSNVGTVTSVNNTQPVNGNVTLTLPDPLPSQTGQSGKFLTTDGTDASWVDLNGKTDTDLSNLTATGINNLVQYAHELDWDNEIVITTSSMSSVGVYSVPSDGIVIACAIGISNTSNSKRIIAGFFRDATGTEADGNNVLAMTHFLGPSYSIGHFTATENFTYMEGDTCYYYARAEGFVNNSVRVSFIPFKKTI